MIELISTANSTILAGIVVVIAAGIASSIFLRTRRVRLARNAVLFMLAGLVVVNIGLWTGLDETANVGQWVLKIAFTAAVVITVPATFALVRHVGRPSDSPSTSSGVRTS
jgi:uncharacterized membrane protein